jgi:hypothetical protein
VHTGFIAQQAPSLGPSPLAVPDEARVILAALLGDASFRLTAFEVPEPYASIGSWQN